MSNYKELKYEFRILLDIETKLLKWLNEKREDYKDTINKDMAYDIILEVIKPALQGKLNKREV